MREFSVKKRKRYAEDSVQESIAKYLRFNGYLVTSQAAGLIQSIRTQITANKLGYLKGSPDLIVWIPGGTINIECKAPKMMMCSSKTGNMIIHKSGGKQSDTQKDFEEKIKKIKGHHYLVASDLMEVIKYIEDNGIKPF